MGRPKVDSAASKELNRLESEFNTFKDNLDNLSKDDISAAPVLEMEPQTKLSSKELKELPKNLIKPSNMIMCRNKFNEKYREEYEYQKQPVEFVAENNEIPGEVIELWTKGWPGVPAEFWKIPVNKPVAAPRYVAEQINRAKYHVFVMQDTVYNESNLGSVNMQYHGSMAVKNTVNRLAARPINQGRSVFSS